MGPWLGLQGFRGSLDPKNLTKGGSGFRFEGLVVNRGSFVGPLFPRSYPWALNWVVRFFRYLTGIYGHQT